ncbi:unnamed protein product, partial [Porites lobata]
PSNRLIVPTKRVEKKSGTSIIARFGDNSDSTILKFLKFLTKLLGQAIPYSAAIIERKAVYNANMIKQTMLYASNVWSACSTGNLQRIFRLQKRSARIILDGDTRANSDELLMRLDWLPLHLEVK